MFDRILVAIDGSKSSYKALDLAINIAKPFKSELYLVSVVNAANLPMNVGVSYAPKLINDLENDAKMDLAKAKDIVKEAGLVSNIKLINGEPREELTEFPKNHKIDLIVMGKTGTSSFARAFIGSVTRYVSEHSKANVLIVE